jgi:hypothetical protein
MCSMPGRPKLIALRVLKSSLVGALLAIALGVLAYVLAPIFDAVMLYAAPSQLLIPIIGPLIPSSLVYRIVPEGGAPAGVLLILTCALIFWTLTFAVIHFLIGSMRRRRATLVPLNPPGN